MKLTLRGALSRYDIVVEPVSEWEYMWIRLRREYWEGLFVACGNVHPWRSVYARQVSLAKRHEQAAQLLKVRMGNLLPIDPQSKEASATPFLEYEK